MKHVIIEVTYDPKKTDWITLEKESRQLQKWYGVLAVRFDPAQPKPFTEEQEAFVNELVDRAFVKGMETMKP